MRLNDKVVIVAGAGLGIGEATVKIAAEEGADIAVVDIMKKRWRRRKPSTRNGLKGSREPITSGWNIK